LLHSAQPRQAETSQHAASDTLNSFWTGHFLAIGGGNVQEMRYTIAEELEQCEDELSREERAGGRRRSSDTADFRETLAGYK